MDSRYFARLGQDWTRLGYQDPLWAVCVDPAKRGGRWDLEDFLATGRAEITDAMARLAHLGLCVSRRDALDFGCGVGRLTSALTEHFGSVTGVDVAPSMIDHARRLHSANAKCTFILNDQPDLRRFTDGSFDLVYSSLVLQHMSPALASAYLSEFVRIVRPGGAIVLLVPESHRRTPRGLVYAYAPRRLVGWMQVRLFGYPAPMQMESVPAPKIGTVLADHGRIVVSEPYSMPNSHWRMVRHFIAAVRPVEESDAGSEGSPGTKSTELT
jgi:SAM-dependent methyltransferase